MFGFIFLKIFLAFPGTPPPERIRRVTERKRTPRLQIIRPVGPGRDPHLYGTLTITAHEAVTGTHKLVNIPWGFQKRLFKVAVPAGIQEGRTLRLRGLGKQVTPERHIMPVLGRKALGLQRSSNPLSNGSGFLSSCFR